MSTIIHLDKQRAAATVDIVFRPTASNNLTFRTKQQSLIKRITYFSFYFIFSFLFQAHIVRTVEQQISLSNHKGKKLDIKEGECYNIPSAGRHQSSKSIFMKIHAGCEMFAHKFQVEQKGHHSNDNTEAWMLQQINIFLLKLYLRIPTKKSNVYNLELNCKWLRHVKRLDQLFYLNSAPHYNL